MTLHLPRKGMETLLFLAALVCSRASLTLHLPRKGMETYHSDHANHNLDSWHYIFPARGWKLFFRNFIIFWGNRVDITSSPQGDGNKLNSPFLFILGSKLTLHLPRKGMETALLIMLSLTFLALLTLHLPRKGMETHGAKLLARMVAVVDITSSPQGDGNSCLASVISNSISAVDITSSPQGDGNHLSPNNCLQRMGQVEITSSPQGDGNQQEFLNHWEWYLCWHYIFPARGWKLYKLHCKLFTAFTVTGWHYIFPARGWKH